MRNTQLVRSIIREHNADHGFMWTNKYKSCRTVKFLNWNRASTNAALAAIKASGIEHTVKFNTTQGYGWMRPSVIIRLPLEY